MDIMQEDFEYESLPGATLAAQLTAGALAGITEHVVTYPFDSMKTRLQELTQQHRSLYRSMVSVGQSEGFASLWRGVGSVIAGSGPAHALFFATYEQSKLIISQFDNSEDKHATHGNFILNCSLCRNICYFSARWIHDAI